MVIAPVDRSMKDFAQFSHVSSPFAMKRKRSRSATKTPNDGRRQRSARDRNHRAHCVTTSRRVRTAVVSSIRLHGDALVLALRDSPGIELVGCFFIDGEASALVAHAATLDVILFDAAVVANTAFIENIRVQMPSVRLIALGIDDAEDEIVACAKAGLAGYIHRQAALEELPRLIIDVIRGELVFSPGMAGRLFRRLATNDLSPLNRDLLLTPREREVLASIQGGLTNKEIASELRIAEATVKNHVHHLLEKLQVKRRLQAAKVDLNGLRPPLRRRAPIRRPA